MDVVDIIVSVLSLLHEYDLCFLFSERFRQCGATQLSKQRSAGEDAQSAPLSHSYLIHKCVRHNTFDNQKARCIT